MNTTSRARANTLFWMFATCLLVSMPFFSAKYPPITDLSQLVAQVQLFWDALSNEHSPYYINWLVPHSLAHFLFVATVGLFGPEYGGTYAMWLLTVTHVMSLFWLTAHFKRPLYTAILGSCLIFSLNLYWGFAAFLIGWPIFSAYVIQVSSQHQLTAKNAPLLALLVALLYFSHLLWFMAAGLWLVLYSVITRKNLKPTIRQCAIFIPLSIPMLLWRTSIRGHDFDNPWLYDSSPIERISLVHLTESLGGLQGGTQFFLLLVIVFVIVLALIHTRGRFREHYDQTLLVTASFLLALYLFLPDVMTSTIALNDRWLPYGLICLIMAMPAIQIRNFVLSAICMSTLFLICQKTQQAWHNFETIEMAGFGAILDALPNDQKALGLDFNRKSKFIKGLPFMQVFTYAQVRKNASMDFSFAEFPTSFVVFKNQKRNDDNDKNFVWNPYEFEVADSKQFEYLIVHSTDDGLDVLEQVGSLERVLRKGNFGLFEVANPDQIIESNLH